MSGTPLSVSSSAEKNNSSSDCTRACCESQVLPSQLGCHSSVISRKRYPMNTMILLSSSSPPGSDNASNEKGLLKTETATQGYETAMDTIGPVVPNSPQRKRVLTPVVVCGSPCMLPQAAVGSPLSAPILSTPSVFGSNIRQENNGLRFCLPCNTKVECATSTNASDVNSVRHQNEPQLRSCAASRSGRQSERQSPLSVPIDNNETVTDSQNRASCSANITATFDKSSLLTASSPELSNCPQAANTSLSNSSSAGAGRRLSAQQISSCPANIRVNVPGSKNVIFNCRSSSDSFNAVPVSEAEKLTGLNRYVLHELKAPRPHAPEIEAIACPSAVEPFRKAWWAGVRPATCERTCRHRSKVCDAIQLCNDCTGYYCKWLADLVGIPVLKASGRVDPLVFHTDPLAKLYWDRISKVVCCPKSMNKCLMCIRRYQLFTHFLPGNLLFRGLVHQSVMKLSEEGFAVDMGLIRKVTRLHLERIAETMELRLPPEYFASLQAYEIILRRGPLVDVIASGLTSALAATSATAAAVSSVKSGRNALSKTGLQNSSHDNETRRQNNNSSCETLSKSTLNNTSATTSNRMCFTSGTLYHYKPRTIKSASHGVDNSSVSSPHAFAANDLTHRDSPEMTESSRSKVLTEAFCKEALNPELSYSFLKDNANRGFPSNTSWNDGSNALLSAYGNSWCSAGIASMKSRISNRVESLESVCRATEEKTSRCCEKCKDDIVDTPDGPSLSSEDTEVRRRSVSSEIREKEHGSNTESFLPQFTGAIVCGSRRRRHQKHMAQIAANHLQSIAPTAARDEDDDDEACGVSKASTRTEPEKKRRPRKVAESEVGSVEQEGHQRHSVESNEQDIMLSQNASSVNNDNNQGLKCGSSDQLKRRLRLRHTLRRPLYKGDSAIYYGDFDGDSQFLFLLNEDKKLKQNSAAEVAVGTQTTQQESFPKQQQHHESENDNEVSSDGRNCGSSKNAQSGNGRKRRRRAFQQRKAKQESLEKGKTVGCNHDEVQENGEVSVADELGFPGCGFDKQLSRSSFLSRGLEAVSANFTELAHQFSPFSDKQQPENISPSSLHRRPIVTPRRQESFRTAESEEMRDVDCCGSEKHLHSATCHVSAVNRVSQDASSSSDLPSKPSLNDALHAEQLEEEMRLADAGVRGVFWDPAKEAWCVLLCLPSCLSPSSLCESFRYGLIQRKIVCFRAKWDSVMSAKWNAVYERLKSNPVELKHIADCVRRELAGWIKGSIARHSNEARTLVMSSPGGSHDIDLFIHSQARDVASSSTSFVDEYPSYCSKTGSRNLFWVEGQHQQLLDKATSSALHSALLSPVLDSLTSQKTARNAPAPCFRDCTLKQWPSCVDGCCNGYAVQQHNKSSDENKKSTELLSCFPPVQRQVEDNKQQACMGQQLETLLSEEERKETSCMNMLSNHVASLPDEWEGGLCELVGQVICGKLCGEGKTQMPWLATFEKTKVLPRCTKQEAEQKKLFVASLESDEVQGLAKKSSSDFSAFTDDGSKASIVLAASTAQQDIYLPSCDRAKEGEEDVDCLSGNVKSRSSPTRLADLLGSLSKALGSTGTTVCLDSERQQPSADNIGRECEDNLTQMSSKMCTTHEEGLSFAKRCLLEDFERSPTTTTTPLGGPSDNFLFPASHKKGDDLYATKGECAQLASPIAQDEQRKAKETCGASINDTSENNPQHVSHVADLLVTLHSKLMEQTTVDHEHDISLQKPSEETDHHSLFSTTVLNCPASFFSSYLPTS